MDAATRRALARSLAEPYGGVVTRTELVRAGVSQASIRSELRAGRWHRTGTHTISPVSVSPEPVGAGLWWRAVRESGSGAVLDGAAALRASGLTGFEPDLIDVAVPRGNTAHPVPNVRVRRPRVIARSVRGGVPRTTPPVATIHAAHWARSDRQAALLLCLVVQQRLVRASDLAVVWAGVRRSPRRRLIGEVIGDLVDGAQSLGELDMARRCRRAGLPPPDRQVVRNGPNRRSYLDLYWEAARLVVEVDGGHHLMGLNPTDDALRANEVALTGDRVLRIPLLGLRVNPDAFMGQIARGLLVTPRPLDTGRQK